MKMVGEVMDMVGKVMDMVGEVKVSIFSAPNLFVPKSFLKFYTQNSRPKLFILIFLPQVHIEEEFIGPLTNWAQTILIRSLPPYLQNMDRLSFAFFCISYILAKYSLNCEGSKSHK